MKKKAIDIITSVDTFLAFFLIKIVKFYQKFFSFDHSAFKIFYPFVFCRFKPTCSEYTIDALKKYGAIRGTLKASWRILRCNPWNKGGYDPVDKNNK
ncbi:membrane protein insertion efficiency factor YidD [Candidatus Parcubacteria bacterium]|nr:MAG: membrane protein insertion efficiency factor YidD [Candidatus Parcubacteria bacterium]